jgi:hypothetical protein
MLAVIDEIDRFFHSTAIDSQLHRSALESVRILNEYFVR